jgi:hypothetical protein
MVPVDLEQLFGFLLNELERISGNRPQLFPHRGMVLLLMCQS